MLACVCSFAEAFGLSRMEAFFRGTKLVSSMDKSDKLSWRVSTLWPRIWDMCLVCLCRARSHRLFHDHEGFGPVITSIRACGYGMIEYMDVHGCIWMYMAHIQWRHADDFGCEAAMRSSTSLAKVTSAFRLWSPGHSSCGLSLLA